jgi:predicted DNA-binding transcriptional regulator YafY
MLTLTYVDAQVKITERRVRPLRLEEHHGTHYLVAYCELRDAERTFRLDRIVEIH